MPSKNIIKNFVPDFYYHLYSRGVNKRIIFKDKQDYSMFITYFKLYLLPVDILRKLSANDIRIVKFIKTNVSNDLKLISFALMPNHFHILVELKNAQGIEKFMRRVLTAYSMYFNQKYKRVGPLFQSRYKAIPVLHDEYLLYLTRYIHRNPLKIKEDNPYEYTSFAYFLKEKSASWIHPDFILQFFNENTPELTYKNFVEDVRYRNDLGELTLE